VRQEGARAGAVAMLRGAQVVSIDGHSPLQALYLVGELLGFERERDYEVLRFDGRRRNLCRLNGISQGHSSLRCRHCPDFAARRLRAVWRPPAVLLASGRPRPARRSQPA